MERITGMHTYSAESAGRMDKGESWELQREGERTSWSQHYLHSESLVPTCSGLGWLLCSMAEVKTGKKNENNN